MCIIISHLVQNIEGLTITIRNFDTVLYAAGLEQQSIFSYWKKRSSCIEGAIPISEKKIFLPPTICYLFFSIILYPNISIYFIRYHLLQKPTSE